jgi:ankyrin repeat protein
MREAKVDQRHASVGISTLRLLYSGVQSASIGPLRNNGSSRFKSNNGTPQPNHESHAHNKIPSQVTLTEEREVGYSMNSTNQAKISKLFDTGLFGKMSSSIPDIEALNNKRKSDAKSRNHFSHTAITNFVQSLFTDQEESIVTINTDNVQSKVADLDTNEIDDVEFDYKKRESFGNQFSQADVTNVLKSLYTNDIDSTIIDTDGAETYVPDVTGADYAEKMSSMLMSPQLITKRYHQALRAIESRNWKQLSYLICANPWLMEMKDVRNDQCLVHTLSLFGGGYNDSTDTALPMQMVQSIIDYEPNVVYKIDIEGNLPLHMAAASGNMIMIEELGRVFPGAGSVQNHDGLLPLHLAVQSCDIFTTCLQAVESLLIMFPGAVGVKDNDGNTPLHTAVTLLRGNVAVTVINLLLMAVNSVKTENVPSLDKSRSFDSLPETLIMMATDTPENVSSNDSRAISWNNNAGETPLTAAIKAKAGLQVVEALINGNYENLAALKRNSDSRNALHLALDMNNGFYDPDVVIFILKTSPLIVTIPDGDGNLPIQLASRNMLQSEIILAISIIDLPIDLEVKECAILRDGFGASWSYLICESNDMHVGVVRQILELCSQPQKEALSLAIARGSSHDIKTVTECATPLCKDELRKSILFLGRFVILGNQRSHVYSWHAQKFDAIDSYSDEKVSLVCYEDAKSYTKDRELLQRIANDTELFEELNYHTVADTMYISAKKTSTSLANVIEGMSHERRIKHFRTSRSILRGIAKSLSKLHRQGIIHGSLAIQNVGKFGKCWKLMDIPGSVAVNELFTACRLGLHSPPEAFITARCKINHERNIASIAPNLAAVPTVDVWAFGKLMYEVLVGESLFKIFSVEGSYLKSSMCIHAWNSYHLKKISRKLISEGINSSAVNLISSCLCPLLSERCKSMSDILDHPFWTDRNIPQSSAVSLQYLPAPDLFTQCGNISEGLLDSVGI